MHLQVFEIADFESGNQGFENQYSIKILRSFFPIQASNYENQFQFIQTTKSG